MDVNLLGTLLIVSIVLLALVLLLLLFVFTRTGQQRAQQLLDDVVAQAHIPDTVDVHANAFHIPAAKGLISASRYASHLVVGSRGLSGLDAHFLGSVSRQLVNFAECTVTVVH